MWLRQSRQSPAIKSTDRLHNGNSSGPQAPAFHGPNLAPRPSPWGQRPPDFRMSGHGPWHGMPSSGNSHGPPSAQGKIPQHAMAPQVSERPKVTQPAPPAAKTLPGRPNEQIGRSSSVHQPCGQPYNSHVVIEVLSDEDEGTARPEAAPAPVPDHAHAITSLAQSSVGDRGCMGQEQEREPGAGCGSGKDPAEGGALVPYLRPGAPSAMQPDATAAFRAPPAGGSGASVPLWPEATAIAAAMSRGPGGPPLMHNQQAVFTHTSHPSPNTRVQCRLTVRSLGAPGGQHGAGGMSAERSATQQPEGHAPTGRRVKRG